MLSEMTFNDPFSLVVIITFLVITFITFMTIRKHHKVYTFLKQLKKEVSGDPRYCSFLQKMKNEYELDTENGSGHNSFIDAETFTESYLSEYKMENGKDLISPLKWSQSAGNIVILIGVLGTFIGLVLSLSQINYEEMNQSVLQLLNGVHTAFYTSIFGIFSSIILHFYTKRFNADTLLTQVMLKTEKYVSKEMQSATNEKMISVLEEVQYAIQGINHSLSGLDLFSEQFEEASHHLEHFNQQFGQNADKLIDHFSDVETLANSLNQNVSQLGGQFGSVIDAFSLQESLIQSLDQNLQTFSTQLTEFSGNQADLQKKQIEAIGEFLGTLKEHKDDTHTFLHTFKGEIKQVFDGMSHFYNDAIAQQKQLITSQEQFDQKNTNLMQNVEKTTSTIKDVVDQGAFHRLGEISTALTQNIQKLEYQLQGFHQFIQKIDQKETEFMVQLSNQAKSIERLNSERQEEHRGFMNYFQRFISQNEMVDVSMKDMLQVLKTYEMNGQRMIEEMKNIKDQMNTSFNDNDRLQQQYIDRLNRSLLDFSEQSSQGLENAVQKTNAHLHQQIEHMVRQLESQQERTLRKLDELVRPFHTQNRNVETRIERLERNDREQAGIIK